MMKWRKKALLAKIETTYGQDPTPTGGANAIQAADVELTPLAGDRVSRNIERPTLGRSPSLLVGKHVTLSFTVELAGSGAAGTKPAWGVLLRGCGLSETVNAGTDVVYQPVSTGEESLGIYVNIDGNLHKLLGARGSVSLDLKAKAMPSLRFSFTGLFVAPAASALPTPDLTPFKSPVPVDNSHTPTFTLHGFEAVMSSLSIDLGVAVAHRDWVNSESVTLNDRSSSGKVTIESPLISTKDFFAAAEAGTLDALQIVHGTVAGNIIQVDAPKVQIENPQYGNDNNTAVLNMDLGFIPDAGDDELVITVK